jgi:predicted ATPase/class 3 adenylate cyclase
MIDLVQNYGGIVGKFGGDAMTVFFPYRSQNQQATTRRAIQCAFDMQARMQQYEAIPTSAGTFSLAMKAGLAAGTLFCTTIGDPDIRLEYLIAGSVLDESAEAEHHAGRGEVVVANHLLPYAGQVIIDERRGRFTSLSRLRRVAGPRPLPHLPPLPQASYPFVSRYIHPNIAQRLQRDQAGFVNEHRQVTVIFASFSGFDYDNDPGVGSKLQQYLTQVIQIVHRYDGYLNKVDMGDKGSKYIILFGTPVGHEDDEERALRCALELRQIPGPAVRVGINTGYVYCGQVGSPLRQEYTVMGDTANLAARLMQAAASSQILAGRATWEPVQNRFLATALPSMRFKGKSESYDIFAVEQVRLQTAITHQKLKYDLPLVGRQEELKRAQALLQAAQQGRGQVLGIMAQAGVGKSRFSSEIIQYTAQQGFVVHVGAAESYGMTTQYLAWRSIWRTFFGLSDTALPADQIRQLTTALNQLNPRLKERLPLLGPVLNLIMPDNELTQSLDPQRRVELLKTLLLDCLRLQAQQQPLLLVLEDCHWLDDLSQELLAYIGHNLADLPVLLLALYRPADSERSPLSWAAPADPVAEIPLQELTAAEAEELARLKFQQLWPDAPTIGATLLEQIISKAGGNPFFLEEMVNYLHDKQIQLDDEKALAELDIPDSLHNLIISRIDQLPETTKTTLKVASVIGRVFPESWIWGSYTQAGTPAQVRQHLDDLRRLDLTPLYQEETEEATYIFKHITTQEVAYESLAFATRAALHEQVGRFIEQAHGENLTQYIDLLAHHYGRSQNSGKQRHYFRQAGNMAQKAYANQAAIDYYQRLLSLLSDAEKAPVCYALAQVRQLIGEWQMAEALYREALNLAQETGQIAVAADASLALGGLLFLSNPEAGQEALNWLQQARQQFELLNDQQGIGRVLERLSFIYSRQGSYEQAQSCARQQLHIAHQHNDPIGISGALNFIGVAYSLQSNFDQAETTLKEAIVVAQDAGHKRGIVLASNDLAGVYWLLGNYHQSLAYLQQSQTISQEIGDEEMSEVSIANAGLLYHHLGKKDEAVFCLLQALAIAIAMNDWATIANQLGNLGNVLAQTGQPDLALALTDRAIELNRSLNMPYYLSEFLQQKARLLAKANQFAQAVSLNEEALGIARHIQHLEIQFEAELLAVRLRLRLQEIDVETAVAALARLATTWQEDAEQAAISYEIAQLMPSEEAQQKAARLYQKLYKTTPKAIYRHRYQILTGDTLPDSPPLPPPPQFVEAERLQMGDLLKRVGIITNQAQS